MSTLRSRATAMMAASALVLTLAGAGTANAADNTPPAPPAKVSTVATAPTASATAPAPAPQVGANAIKNRDAILKAMGTTEYRYGQPIPMGEHANFTPFWWGMQFTLDGYAAKQLNDALASGKSIAELVTVLMDLGIPAAPVVAVVIKGIVIVLNAIADHVARSTTEDGLIINSLWVPIPWVTQPAGPFVPAQPLPRR